MDSIFYCSVCHDVFAEKHTEAECLDALLDIIHGHLDKMNKHQLLMVKNQILNIYENHK